MGRQYAHVKEILEGAERALAIHEIGARIWNKFRVRHADTAISARIREIRADLELKGKRTIHSRRAGPNHHHHVYAIGRMARA
jgi:hypothetical protein